MLVANKYENIHDGFIVLMLDMERFLIEDFDCEC